MLTVKLSLVRAVNRVGYFLWLSRVEDQNGHFKATVCGNSSSQTKGTDQSVQGRPESRVRVES